MQFLTLSQIGKTDATWLNGTACSSEMDGETAQVTPAGSKAVMI